MARIDRTERRRQDDDTARHRRADALRWHHPAGRRGRRAHDREAARAHRGHRAAAPGSAAADDDLRVRAARPHPVHPLLRYRDGERPRRRARRTGAPRYRAVRRPTARLIERRRAAARGPCARAGSTGADPAARRRNERARHREPAAGARAGRRYAPERRVHGRERDARPDARGAVRSHVGADQPGPRDHRRRAGRGSDG